MRFQRLFENCLTTSLSSTLNAEGYSVVNKQEIVQDHNAHRCKLTDLLPGEKQVFELSTKAALT